MKKILFFFLFLISFYAKGQPFFKLQFDNINFDSLSIVQLSTGKIGVDSNYIKLFSGGGSGSVAWGGITGTLSDQTDLYDSLNARQRLNTHLTTISSLSPTNDDILQYKSGAWTHRSISQLKTDLSLSGTNTGDQDLSGLVPNSRTITINGVAFDLSLNRTWTIAAGGEDLATTLGFGNFTGGNNILLSDQDNITGRLGISRIVLDDTTIVSGNGLQLFGHVGAGNGTDEGFVFAINDSVRDCGIVYYDPLVTPGGGLPFYHMLRIASTAAVGGMRFNAGDIDGVGNSTRMSLSDNAQTILFEAANGVGINNYTLPLADGNADEVVTTDGAGNLFFVPIPAGGEVNTASNLGGGLSNFDSKSGVDLRFNSFKAADFDLSSNVIGIDYTNSQAATSGQNGFLSAAKYSDFDNKQAALVSGTNIKTINSTSLLGSGDISLQTSTLTNGNFLVGNGSNVSTSVTPTGDVTFSNAGVFTIGSNKVTLGMMAALAANSVIGNNTGSAATPIALTMAQLDALIGEYAIVSTGDFPTASTSMVDVTDMAFAVVANSNYEFTISGRVGESSTNGARWTIVTPASCSLEAQFVLIHTNGGSVQTPISASAAETATAGTLAITGYAFTIRGSVRVGATAGTVKLQVRSFNAANTVTHYAGTMLWSKKVN